MALVPIGLGALNKYSDRENTAHDSINEVDPADQFSYKTTPLIISLLIALVAYQQYIENPSSCFFPNEQRDWIVYVDKVCWVDGHYYASVSQGSRQHTPDTSKIRVAIYQWTPFILAIQAIFFYIPHAIWKFAVTASPFKASDLIVLSHEIKSSLGEQRKKALLHMVKLFEKFMKVEKREEGVSCRRECCRPHGSSVFKVLFGKYRGVFLFASHVFIKLLYIINGIGQIFVLQYCFNQSTFFFGINNMVTAFRGADSEMSRAFPPVVYCRVELKTLNGSDDAVYAQCSIPGNVFNKMIYAFLWFWTLMASVISFVSLIVWIARMSQANRRKGFVSRCLKLLSEQLSKVERRAASKFVQDHIRRDGIFMLDLISKQVGELVAAEVIEGLWETWRDSREEDNLEKSDSEDNVEQVNHIELEPTNQTKHV